MYKSSIENQGNFAKPMLSDAVFRPMLFSTTMVQAILKGTKIETRRKINIDSKYDFMGFEIGNNYRMPNHIGFGSKKDCEIVDLIKQKMFINDIIWVRETFAVKGQRIFYKADNDSFENAGLKGLYDFVWKPSLFMPKDVCRLFLEVENVRVERLLYISEEDAINEGLETSIVKSSIFQTYLGYRNYYVQDAEDELYFRSPIDSYKSLWMSINGSKSWLENPFVWVYSFKVVECPYGFR